MAGSSPATTHLYGTNAAQPITVPPGRDDKVMHAALKIGETSFGMVTDRFGVTWMVVRPLG